MNKENPFKKSPQPSAAPTPEPEAGPDSNDLCPLIGGIAAPIIDQSRLIRSANPAEAIGVGFQLLNCQRQKCHFWNQDQEACAVKMGMESLVRLEKSLGKMFPG